MNMSVAPNGGHGAGSALISVLRSRRMTSAPDEDALVNLLSRHAEPLPAPDDEDFGRAFDRFGDARVVLIGEASHGTSEFYQARAAISRRLVEHHGFSIVAVEADWPDAAQLDAWVRARTEQDWRQDAFRRFPLWMWRNREVAAFSEWLRAFNRNSGRAGGVSWSGRLQPECFAGGGAAFSERARPRGRAPGPAALRLPDPLAGRAGRLRPAGDPGRRTLLRAGRGGAAARTAGAASGFAARRRRGLLRRRAQRPGGAGRRAVLPGNVPGRQYILEPARPAHVRHPQGAAGPSRPRRQGAGLGAQLAPGQC